MTNAKKTLPILLLSDAWDEDGVRHVAGTTPDFPVALAKKLIDDGKAERADPLPSDD